MPKDFNLDERIADVFTAAPQYQANHVKQLILDTLEAVKPERATSIPENIATDNNAHHYYRGFLLGFNACLDQLDSNIREVLKNPAT